MIEKQQPAVARRISYGSPETGGPWIPANLFGIGRRLALSAKRRPPDLWLSRNVKDARHAAVSILFARRRYDPTSEQVFLDNLGLAHADRHPYTPSPWWILHWVLPRSEVKRTDVFVEYGCGKGRVVLAAARRYPFAEVVGVELSEQLAADARRLVNAERTFRARDVHIKTLDAGEFQVPDTMTHAYMFKRFRPSLGLPWRLSETIPQFGRSGRLRRQPHCHGSVEPQFGWLRGESARERKLGPTSFDA